MWKLTLSYHILQCDETLPNSIKKKAPKKLRENETRGLGPKSRQANSPTKAGPLKGNGSTRNQTIAILILKIGVKFQLPTKSWCD
jgi:hypothetical protein